LFGVQRGRGGCSAGGWVGEAYWFERSGLLDGGRGKDCCEMEIMKTKGSGSGSRGIDDIEGMWNGMLLIKNVMSHSTHSLEYF
jgi:hypothetical protein